jgi:hypothetical protein
MNATLLLKILTCSVGIWIGVNLLRGYIGGWMRLARTYRASSQKKVVTGISRRRFFQTAYMRWLMVYGDCMMFRADNRGLRISVLPVFRIGHPSLLIPWDEITVVNLKGLFKPIVELRFQAEPSVPLRMSRLVYQSLAENFSSIGDAH